VKHEFHTVIIYHHSIGSSDTFPPRKVIAFSVRSRYINVSEGLSDCKLWQALAMWYIRSVNIVDRTPADEQLVFVCVASPSSLISWFNNLIFVQMKLLTFSSYCHLVRLKLMVQ